MAAAALGKGFQIAGGRYVLLESIGQGGMGDIYKAHDRQLDRIVAIKAVRADREDDTGKRLTREARLAASIDHPFICKVHELLHLDDGRVVLVMEFLEGRTLKDLLQEGRPLEVPRVLRIAREVAEAMSVAHKAQLIHRDIKPSNVMITTHGHVKVMDFGIAKASTPPDASTASTISEVGQIIGTPAYMSPEQAAGRPVDARSDVFSFGVLLYECLTAQRPFGELQFSAAPKALPPNVPADLRALVMRCLQFPRDRRFGSFDEVRSALDTSMLLRISVVPTDGKDLMGRNRMAWFALAGIVVAVGIAATIWSNGAGTPTADRLEHGAFVTWPTNEEAGRVSPDGTKVAFVSTTKRKAQLWIGRVDGSEPQKVGTEHDAIKTPVWSPDGQQLAYLQLDADRPRLAVLMQFGEALEVAPIPNLQWRATTLIRWLRSSIYFGVSGADDTTAVLWRYATTDGAVRQITHDPDGKRFISNGRLANLDIDATETQIVFEPAAPENGRLWIADIDGRNAKELPVRPNLIVTPRWRGPNGHIVYADNASGQSDIWEFNPRSGRSIALTTSPLEEVSLDVSASGRVIVADTLAENAHLWAVHPDRPEGPRQITNDSRSDLSPGVGPGGQLILHRGKSAFIRYVPNDTEIYTAVFDNDGLAGERRVAEGTGGSLSADSRLIAFLRFAKEGNLPELWISPVDGSRPAVRIEQRPSFPGIHIPTWETLGQTVAWSPVEATTLFYARRLRPNGVELVRVRIDKDLGTTSDVMFSEIRETAPGDQENIKDVAVAPQGNLAAIVIASRMPNRGGRILCVDLNTGNGGHREVLTAPMGSDIALAGWTGRGTLAATLTSGDTASGGEIVEVRPEGHVRQKLGAPGLLGFSARVDAAHNRVVFTSQLAGVATVRSVDLVSGRARTLVANEIEGITFGGYATAPDGTVIYVRKEVNHDVWLFRARPANSGEIIQGR
jgi:Tol biopolymer transport system component/tRNA A-37 threonylcarbamoyl transferase component Bud32